MMIAQNNTCAITVKNFLFTIEEMCFIGTKIRHLIIHLSKI